MSGVSQMKIAIVGQFSSGKSALINALLRRQIVPMGVEPNGQQLYRIIPKALYIAVSGGKLTLDGGGVSERSFIFKEDIASSINAIILNGKAGETYHFTDTNCISIKHLIKKISSICNIDFENFTTKGKERLGKDHRYLMSSEKVNNLLNWYPKISLDDGIQKTLAWVKEIKHFIQPELLQYHHIYRDYHEPNT